MSERTRAAAARAVPRPGPTQEEASSPRHLLLRALAKAGTTRMDAHVRPPVRAVPVCRARLGRVMGHARLASRYATPRDPKSSSPPLGASALATRCPRAAAARPTTAPVGPTPTTARAAVRP